MVQWIAHWVGALGTVGVALLMAIENVVLPMPSELIMPLAGFEAAHGDMTLVGVIVAGTIGSVLGALPVYWAARAFGEERIAHWIERHGRWLVLTTADLRRADRRFKARGGWAVVIAQLIPGVRGLIALPAGFAEMNVTLFVLANLAGTVVWCAVLAVLGQELGAHYQRVHDVLGPVGWAVGVLLVAGAAVWVIRRRRRRRDSDS